MYYLVARVQSGRRAYATGNEGSIIRLTPQRQRALFRALL